MSVDIVIVNWNAGEHLRKCLESIQASDAPGSILGKVVVVDNASSDGSVDHLEDIGLPVRLIRNTSNQGFAKACNQGARECDAEYLLFLNPDTEVFRRSLQDAVAFMDDPAHRQIGICGIQLVDEHGAITISCARFPTLRILFGKMAGLNRLLPQAFPEHHMTASELQSNREVDQVIGAFFLVRKSVFDELQGFDERFFVYFEEVDFSLRAKRKGYSSFYLADAKAFHEGCVSSNQIKATRLFYSLRSRLQYAFKHFSRADFLCVAVLTFSLEIFSRLLKVLCRPSWSQLTELVSGYRQLVGYFMRSAYRSESN